MRSGNDAVEITPAEAAAGLATALSVMGESLEVIMESVGGYRRRCCEAGFSDSAAEVMATAFHHMLLAKFFG